GWSFAQGAAVPEAWIAAYLNLFEEAGLRAGEIVLIHAGASGVGTAAIQLVREAGARCWVTAGSAAKIARCVALGATAGWNYKEGPFAPWVKEQVPGGVDIILDFIGAPYFAQNIESLAVDGRLIIIGTMGGTKVEQMNLGVLLGRRLQVIGTALRSRSPAFKSRLTADFAAFALPRFADGRLVPIVDSVFNWRDVAAAHAYMESNANIGKIVLQVADE
ncbi:MAG: zinc-binding dehydrogenase, partial [Alicyclobacillus sp.]|nr:zinc-binding dehydrogenase [Alicyclobacillus sp.]